MSDTTVERDHWVGFDLGGTKMLASVFNAEFDEIGRRRKKTRGNEGQKSGLERIVGAIQDAIEDAKVEPGRIAGIGIGCPGPIELDTGVIKEAPNLGWGDVPVRETLEKEFGCPVSVLNDVDAGVYGEYRFGAGKGARTVVGVFPGTGIGGGCVYDGTILRGATYSCMEIGHVVVTGSEGPISGTERRGILELAASRLAISGAAAQAAFRGDAPNLLDDAGTDLKDIRSGALADAIAKGDTVIENIVREASELIGIAVANVVHLLSPDVIVLGGGLVEAMPDLIVKTVEKTARKTVLPTYEKTFEVRPAKLGDDACVRGAASWIREVVARGPKS